MLQRMLTMSLLFLGSLSNAAQVLHQVVFHILEQSKSKNVAIIPPAYGLIADITDKELPCYVTVKMEALASPTDEDDIPQPAADEEPQNHQLLLESQFRRHNKRKRARYW